MPTRHSPIPISTTFLLLILSICDQRAILEHLHCPRAYVPCCKESTRDCDGTALAPLQLAGPNVRPWEDDCPVLETSSEMHEMPSAPGPLASRSELTSLAFTPPSCAFMLADVPRTAKIPRGKRGRRKEWRKSGWAPRLIQRRLDFVLFADISYSYSARPFTETGARLVIAGRRPVAPVHTLHVSSLPVRDHEQTPEFDGLSRAAIALLPIPLPFGPRLPYTQPISPSDTQRRYRQELQQHVGI